jgi:hypothetical protein
MRVTGPRIARHPVRLAREAFAPTFQGSRRDLAQITAWRVQAGLLFLWLAARCVHLSQAGIDLAAGSNAYTHPALASIHRSYSGVFGRVNVKGAL